MDKTYDAFITYRSGQDSVAATSLYEIIKRNGLRPAIDSVDFSPTETFLDEMARCVQESRYTIALVSPRYATSHFTQEEAIMQQILDNREKQRRLVVAYLEDHPAPLWMQSRVGIRLFRDKADPKKPELKRLLKLLLTKERTLTPEAENKIEATIESNWKKLPKQLAEVGLYGLAAYGALSAVAALDTSKDVATGVLGDLSTDGVGASTAAATEHFSDNASGAAKGIGRVLKGLFDDLW